MDDNLPDRYCSHHVTVSQQWTWVSCLFAFWSLRIESIHDRKKIFSNSIWQLRQKESYLERLMTGFKGLLKVSLASLHF